MFPRITACIVALLLLAVPLPVHPAQLERPVSQGAAVTITISVTPPFIDQGQAITVSFVIMPAVVQPQWPSGTVTLRYNDGTICSVQVHSAGSCTFIAPGRVVIQLDYSGDDTFAPSSTPVALPVRLATTLVIEGQPPSIKAGQIMTLTGGIRSDGIGCLAAFFCAPTGQVTYYDRGLAIGVTAVHPRIGFVLPITVTLATPGIHILKGGYSGDTRYSPSISPPITVEVSGQLVQLPLVVQP